MVLNILPIAAGLLGVALGCGFLWIYGALSALKSTLPFKAALSVALFSLLTSLFPWGLFMVDSLSRRVVISGVPTLAEELAKAFMALSLLASTKSQLTLPAAALAVGVLFGSMESALTLSRCIPAPTELTEKLCAFSVLIRPTGQALMTFCTMIAVVHRRWVALGLLVITHLIVNLTGLLNLNLRRSALSPEMVDFVYDAGRQVIMFVVAGLIALWLRRALMRQETA